MNRRLDRKMLALIFTLAWPTMLEELMQTAVQYIDTAMVGTLGTQATAAVGATTTVSWLVGSTVSAVGVGFLALISQCYGAGDQQRAKRTSAQAVTVTLLVGLLFTAVTIGFGFKGGEVVPSFFVGACFGCVLGGFLGLPPGLAEKSPAGCRWMCPSGTRHLSIFSFCILPCFSGRPVLFLPRYCAP